VTSSPLLSVRQARVDRDGAPLCEDIDVETDGQRVVIAGPGAEGIFEAISMAATVSRGRILVTGYDVATQSHVGHVGIAPLDPPLPIRMTVEGYLDLSFRTLGLSGRAANAAVAASLGDLGLASLARRRTDSLAVPERRAVALAAAMLPGSRSLVAHAPLFGLEGHESQYVLSVLGHVSARRQVLATALRFDAASPEWDLVLGATHVVLASRHAALWAGATADLVTGSPKLALYVRNATDAFVDALAQAGFLPHGTPPRLTVTLNAHVTTMDLLSIAQRTNAAIVEMIPLSRTQAPTPDADSRTPAPESTEPPTEESPHA
jgi:ABC-type Na+ transport system ATPase subunit NatA